MISNLAFVGKVFCTARCGLCWCALFEAMSGLGMRIYELGAVGDRDEVYLEMQSHSLFPLFWFTS